MMDKKWKKRMIVHAEKNSERAPSLSAADHIENEQVSYGLGDQGVESKKDKMLEDVGQSKLKNRKLGHDSFKKLNKKQRRLLLERLWRSDSESSESSIDVQTWKNFADSITLNSTSSEEEDMPEIPSVFRKKNKLPVGKHKKYSNPLSLFKIQNISDASNNTINEEGPAPKKHRNSVRFKVNIEPTEPLPSSSTQKYIQFTVTHEYAAIPYTETVQRVINVTAPNGISDVIDSRVMEYITSNASLSRSNLDFSIFTCDKYLKQADLNAGESDVHSSIRTLQRSFDKFRSDVLLFLEKSESQVPESHNSFTRPNNINSEVFRKLFEDELPSKSVAEFEKLNRLLAKSKIHREELVNRYRIVISGESCLKNCVNKIMAHTLSHEVQSVYSGSGKKFRGVKKLNYSKTETYKCLKDVLEEKFGVEYLELKKLKSRVGQWLANYVSRSK